MASLMQKDGSGQCDAAPQLILDIPGNSLKDNNQASRGSMKGRPQSAKFPKGHNIVQKDYYRLMKEDTTVRKHLEKKQANEMGRAMQKTLLEKKNSKYRPVGEVISDSYARAELPEHKLYMIDKVVRMRCQHGRFGIDHSELLNYELE